LLDVDGVLVTSWRPLPGAVETVGWLRQEDIPFRLVTNTTQHSRAGLAAILCDAGMPVQAHEVMTATVATAAYLRRHHPGARCHLLATGEALEDLRDVERVEEGAEVVIVGDAEDGFNYESLNRAFRMLMEGAALVAMHRGLYWMTSEGLTLDVGAFIAGFEAAAGVQAAVAGKPSPDFFLSAAESIGLPADALLMAGDDVQNDVNASQEVGMRAVLVKTGRFRGGDLQLLEPPAEAIDSIVDLPSLLS